MSTDPRRILVLGGGFAGVYTARYLEKLLRPEEATITLVNRENYWVYQPMLPEVISGSIGLTDVVSPIRRLCPRTNLVMREVEEIDLKNRIVTVSPGFRPRQLQLTYDHLGHRARQNHQLSTACPECWKTPCRFGRSRMPWCCAII